jgi:hypothetical protein
MSFIADIFGGGTKEKAPKAPATTDTAIQDAAAEAQRRAALSRGRGSTILTGGGLGNVG